MNKTEICNLALIRLGITQPIASVDDLSNTGKSCKATFRPSLEFLLRERPWPFSTRQIDLALVGEQIFSNWFYTYRFPSGFISVMKVVPAPIPGASSSINTQNLYYDSDRVPPPDSYPFAVGADASGRLLHTNLSQAYAIGSYFDEDTTHYDPMFADALAWRMASEMAFGLTKSSDIYAVARSNYMEAVSAAFAMALNEEKPDGDGDRYDCEQLRARL